MELGEKIIALRRSKSMTQSELGAKLNVTFQAVSKWELGGSLPSPENLLLLSTVLEADFSSEEAPPPAE